MAADPLDPIVQVIAKWKTRPVGESAGSAVARCRMELEDALAQLRAGTQQEDWVAKRLRQEWWMGHGCSVSALYDGDDGEMQCNALTCMRDFKREPLETLREFVEGRRLKIAAETMRAGTQEKPDEHETRSPDGDGQAMIGVSVTERDDTVRPPTPNSPQLGPRDSVRSSDGGAVLIPLRSQPRQTEAGSEPAESHTTSGGALRAGVAPPDQIVSPAPPSEWLKVIHAIAVEAMTAQSDPQAEAQVYRKALIGICNMALKAQDVLVRAGAAVSPPQPL